ncbi:MAG: ATP-binding cassette domain-containing protein, partial [Bifidobacteriaceae bacterium]|nr:ATP-binding cassette domain-containing protein [Bifidobacteriaceae bacterium]
MSADGIDLRDLRVEIAGRQILRGVNLGVAAGARLGIVGESGSGKSMTAKALAGLLPRDAVVSGECQLGGAPLDLGAPDRVWRAIRGGRVVWLPQDPFTSLDPLRRCGPQIAAGLRLPRAQRRAAAEARLADVGLEPGAYGAFPHELSGGMRQRVAIAAALAPEPVVLIADEPTTALDAQTREDVLDLLERLSRDRRATLVLITHDLALAARRADYLAVFQGGRVVEFGPTKAVLAAPSHAHTRELSVAVAAPVAVDDAGRSGGAAQAGGAVRDGVVVRALGLAKTYHGAARPALEDATLDVAPGEIVGVVGESGSGKTTLARLLLGLERPDAGTVEYRDDSGRPVPWNAHLAQLVFQNPYTSLNPTMTARATVAEALRATGGDAARADELLTLAGLDPVLARRKPGR